MDSDVAVKQRHHQLEVFLKEKVPKLLVNSKMPLNIIFTFSIHYLFSFFKCEIEEHFTFFLLIEALHTNCLSSDDISKYTARPFRALDPLTAGLHVKVTE